MKNPWEKFIEGSLVGAFEQGRASTRGPAPDRNLRGWEFVLSTAVPPQKAQAITRANGRGAAQRVDPEAIVSGLVERGLPEHVAQAFAAEIGEESGFDPGINESKPLVEGSRGGFGLIQVTGPRRDELENLAQQRGVSPADVGLQLDQLVNEFFGSEKRAGAEILATNSVPDARVKIVTQFLRPAKENQQKRVQRILGTAEVGI
mgnify:CR=1 FL=1